jgi:hypothetical protein
MAVTSVRTIAITFSGDINATNSLPSAPSGVSPGSITIHSLAPGDNTIALPTGGSTPVGATIIPPSGNPNALTLKGVGGDTGIRLGKTDPTSLAFDTTALPANIVINAATTTTGVRIIWT